MSHRPVSWRLSLVAVIYTLSSDSTFRCSGVSQSYTKSRIRSGSPSPTHTQSDLDYIPSPNFAAIDILLQVISICSKKELPILILHWKWSMSCPDPWNMFVLILKGNTYLSILLDWFHNFLIKNTPQKTSTCLSPPLQMISNFWLILHKRY